MRSGTKWTEIDDNLLKKYVGKMRYEELGRVLQRSSSAVLYRARLLGLPVGYTFEKAKPEVNNYTEKPKGKPWFKKSKNI